MPAPADRSETSGALGPLQQTATEQYPCEGACGVFMQAPGLCLACWYTRNPLPEQTLRIRRLPADHPRRRP